MGFGVRGLGFGVWGSGFGVRGSGFRGLGSGVFQVLTCGAIFRTRTLRNLRDERIEDRPPPDGAFEVGGVSEISGAQKFFRFVELGN